MKPINNKAIFLGIIFGVGIGLALKSILLGISFGLLFYAGSTDGILGKVKKKKK